jgi:virulence-associated protein VagC
MKTSTVISKGKGTGAAASTRLPTGKVFKSGNSAALRLPAGLQVPVGKTYALTVTASGFVAVDPADQAKRRKAMAALFGAASDFPLRES